MSCSSSHVYGYGFECEDMPISTSFKFIKNHIDALKHIIQSEPRTANYMANFNNAVDLLMQTDLNAMASLEGKTIDYELVYDNYPDICDAWENIYEEMQDLFLRDAIVDIIFDETAIGVCYERGQSDDCEGEGSILFIETTPWNYSDYEKSLTQDDFDRILKPYVKELGYKPKDLDYLSIEYYG